MAANPLMPLVRYRALDANGDPLNGAKLNFYIAGTSTRKDTYSDVALASANANPVVADSGGLFGPIYLGTGAYKVVLTTSADVEVWSQDDVSTRAVTPTVLAKTGAYTVATADGTDLLVKADATGGAFTVTLYTAVGGTGNRVTVKKTDSSANAVTVDGDGTETIDGSLTAVLTAQYQVITIESDGTNWHVLEEPSVDPSLSAGRLTLTTALPVTTADVTGASTIYYTPHVGNQTALYTGARWVAYTFAELSVATSGGTASRPHDVFLDYNDGSPALALLAWTNDTTRATALTRQDGVWVLTGDTQQRYLGTAYLDGSKQIADAFANRELWNAFNRVDRPMRKYESADTWTYTTATVRQANGAAGNKLQFVVGLAEDGIVFRSVALAENSSSDVRFSSGIGYDSTTAYSGLIGTGNDVSSNREELVGMYSTIPAIGLHYGAWLEESQAVGTTTWWGDGGGVIVQCGIEAMWRS